MLYTFPSYGYTWNEIHAYYVWLVLISLETAIVNSGGGRDFLHLRRLALEPTQPAMQWVPGHSRQQRSWGVALTTHPFLAPR
jgi:hypothetical protein